MVKKRKKLDAPLFAGQAIHDLLTALGGSRPRSRLEELWQAWPDILGEELADWVQPLGSQGTVLVLGATDAMQMQEMHFISEEVLMRANEFLREPYFASVRICLAEEGKNCRAKERVPLSDSSPAPPSFTLLSGKYLKSMSKTSPVYKCYALFAKKMR